MDKKAFRFTSFILFAIILIGAAVLSFNDDRYKIEALALYAIFSALLIYHKFHYITVESSDTAGKLLLLAGLLLSIIIQKIDNTHFTGFYFYILIVDTIMVNEASFSVPFTVIAIAANIQMLVQRSSSFEDFWIKNGYYLVPRAVMVVTAVITHYMIRLSKKNQQLAESLQEKTIALETALKEISANMAELKETADLRAREKLMQELHDKLGHLLATAFVGVQAAGILLEKDTADAKKRLEMTAQQIQTAMKSIRSVISGESVNNEEMETGFTQSMISLLSQTEKRTGIPIRHNLSLYAGDYYDILPIPIRSFIYHALMEGLTNGIRHGVATAFEFDLRQEAQAILFCLSNNGKTCGEIVYGYGLTKMRREAGRLGAEVILNNQDGFALQIMIPIKGQTEKESVVIAQN